MHFAWKGQPTLMFPSVAYYVPTGTGAWRRCSSATVENEAEPLSPGEFWTRFGASGVPPFPTQFSLLDRPGVAAVPAQGSKAAQQQQQQPQPPTDENEES